MKKLDTVVVFRPYLSPRILHGVDAKHFVNEPNVAINPKFPRGIPPEYWMLVDGQIKVMTPKFRPLHPSKHPHVQVRMRPSKLKYALTVLISVALTAAVFLIKR